MRIAIMGSGGVGGYFGAKLALAGNDVTFIARGAHLAAMKQNGLALKTAEGTKWIRPAPATDDPAKVGAVDYVLFAVKAYDVASAGAQMRPLVGPQTAVIDLLNGVDSADELDALVGRDHVLPGVAYISSHIEAPGVIGHAGAGAKIVFGEFDGRATPRTQAFHAAALQAGFDCTVAADVPSALWSKFCMLASMAAVCCLTRLTLGETLENPASANLIRRAMIEVEAVATAKGIRLEQTVEQSYQGFAKNARASRIKPSMLVDLERGKPLEVGQLSGSVVRHGRAAGVATPVHEVAAAALAPHARGHR